MTHLITIAQAVAVAPLIDLYLRVASSHGCDNEIFRQRGTNSFYCSKECSNCAALNINAKFMEHVPKVSKRLKDAYDAYIEEHDLYAPEPEYFTPMSVFIRQVVRK